MTTPKQATAEQLLNLLFPCLEAVGRLGTPVYLDTPPVGVAEVDAWDEGPAVIVHPEQEWGMWLVRSIATGHTTTVPESYVSVMLEDATGRAHVARAVASVLGQCQWASLERWEAPDGRAQAWTIPYGTHIHRFWYANMGRGPCRTLDWFDDTRMPDGSRLVDALALKAIALHVLGGGQ